MIQESGPEDRGVPSEPTRLASPFLFTWLNGLFVGIASVLCLQGMATTAIWMAVAGCVPILRLCFDGTYRRAIVSLLREEWIRLDAYSKTCGNIPWRAALLWVALPVVVVLLARDHGIVSGDSEPVVMETASFLAEGNWELSELLGPEQLAEELPYFFQRVNSGVYSSYPSGMVVLALPVTALAKLAGSDLTNPEVFYRIQRLTAAAVAACSMALFFLVALHVAPVPPAYAMTLIVGFGSAMFTTVGQGLWQHDGVVLGTLTLLLIEFRRPVHPLAASNWLQGALCAFMVACRLSSVLIIVPFGLWVLLRQPLRAVRLGVTSGLIFIPWAIVYYSIYGNAFGPSMGQMQPHNWSQHYLTGLAGILISPARGLFVYQPWILLLGVTLLPAFRCQQSQIKQGPCPPGWQAFCAIASMLYIPLLASWGMWWGGGCWGTRLLTETIPLLGLLCARPVAFLWRMATGRRLVLALGVASCLMHVPAIFLRSYTWDEHADPDRHQEVLFRWSAPPFLYPLLRPPEGPAPSSP